MKVELSQKFDLEERDFFLEPFSKAELKMILGDTPANEIFSWRSPSAKDFRSAKDQLDNDDLIDLMLNEPKLIRRPLILANGRLILGSDKNSLTALLSPKG